MKPVDQTKFRSGDGSGARGNCMQACVASLLDLPLDKVPDFVNESLDGWMAHLKSWALENGLYVGLHDSEEMTPEWFKSNPYYIANGKGPRVMPSGEAVRHSVIMSHGNLSHDPHPSRAGLVTVDYAITLTPATTY